MTPTSRRGFTLIELLTVIAIIALLAAILFPVFQRVQENRRAATCISNMHDLWVAVNLYKDDNGAFPNTLFGVAERPDGLPYLQGGPGPVPMGQVQHSPLFPTFLKDLEKFHCPDNTQRNKTIVVQAAYPQSSPWSSLLPGGVPTFTNGGMAFSNLPAAYDNQPVSFYGYDSYGISSSMDLTGKRLTTAGSSPGYFVVYSRDWTAARAQGKDPRQDNPNQLLYPKTMPADKTVLTWCDYHVTTAAGDKCPTILASGTAKQLDFKLLLRDGFNVVNR